MVSVWGRGVDSSAAADGSPLLGISENLDRIPEHEREGKADTFSSSTQMTLKETRNLLKTAQASKVVNPFTRALTPPL
jgi:hypothetical protein